MSIPNSLSKLITLSCISPAAFLVKVKANILLGYTFFSVIKYAIRLVITLVLPDPAPANTSKGPSVLSTAILCCSFNFPSIMSCDTTIPIIF